MGRKWTGISFNRTGAQIKTDRDGDIILGTRAQWDGHGRGYNLMGRRHNGTKRDGNIIQWDDGTMGRRGTGISFNGTAAQWDEEGRGYN